MRHKMKGRKLGRNAGERKALFLNLAKSLIKHGSITTTVPKAKDLRPIVERLVTKARNGTLHIRRQLISQLRDPNLVDYLITEVAPVFKDRNGGYTRIIRKGFRFGDNAPMAIIQFVGHESVLDRVSAMVSDSQES